MSQTVVFTPPSVIQTMVTQVAALQTSLITPAQIQFYLNGSLVTISRPDPTMTLVDYLRYYTPYRGVKQHCRQGGCGVCAVMISFYDTDSAVWRNISANSCLKLLVSCDGQMITTTEGIKLSASQYHPVQERIAKTYGLQCGACTTAQVMTQYTALQANTYMQRANYSLLEKNFDGNLCRCSCYPGIIKMARSFLPTGTNGSPQVYNAAGQFIGWDLNATGPGSATTGADDGFYFALGYTGYASTAITGAYIYNQLNPKGFLEYNPALDVNATSNLTIKNWLQSYPSTIQAATFSNAVKGVSYYRATTLPQVISQIQTYGISNVKLVAGATSYGVPGYARPTTSLFIDVNNITELHATRVTSTGAVFGGNVPINKAVMMMFSGASSDPKFNAIANHLFYISGNHVRNTASLCGGIVMAKQGAFASDAAPVLMAANATLNVTYVYASSTSTASLTVAQYLAESTATKYIIINSVVIPAAQTGEIFFSYRLAQRYFNSHAWLNIATSCVVDPSTSVISNTRIAYGGLESGVGCSLAPTAMSYFNGKNLSPASTGGTGEINTIISGMISAISTDIDVQIAPIPAFQGVYGDGKVAFRKNLAKSLWYDTFLNLLKVKGWISNYPSLSNSLESWISGTPSSTRVPDVQYADLTQIIMQSDYPAHYSWPKLDGIDIASGEVRYTDDMPLQMKTLWGASALSTIAVGEVDWASATTINALATARATTGVFGVVTVSDLVNCVIANNSYNVLNQPGYTAITDFTGANNSAGGNSFETFGNRYISYYGQRIAIVLSEDQELAQSVASNMTFGYKNQYTGYATTIFDGINKGFIMNFGTSTNGLNRPGYNLGTSFTSFTWPFTGGNTAYDLTPGTITYNAATNDNLLPRSDSPTGFTKPDGTLYTSYFYTGIYGQIFPWSPYILESTGAYTSEKYHMALERLSSNCYIDEDNCFNIYATCQRWEGARTEMRKLGLLDYQLRCKERRIAGAFGQKLTQSMNQHCVASIVCAWIAKGYMIRLVPYLSEDSQTNGAESEMYAPYSIAFDATGTINSSWLTAYTETLYGANPAWKALSAAAYPITSESTFGTVEAIKTLQSYFQNTFGWYITPQSVSIPRPGRVPYRGPYTSITNYVYGDMMDNISAVLDKSFTDVSYINAPQATWWPPGTTTIPINQDRYEWKTMMDRFETLPKYDYANRLAAVQAFNAANKYVKRGLSIYFGKYDALLFVSANSDTLIKIQSDGTVLLYICYSESGQGGSIKAKQLIASKLKVPLSMIKVVEIDTNFNQGDTGNASSRGTNNLLRGVEDACNKALARFAPNIKTIGNEVFSYNLFNSNGTVNAAQTNLSAAMTGNNGVGNVAPWKALIASQSSSFVYYQTGTNGNGIVYPTASSPAQSTAVNDLVFQGRSVNGAAMGTGAVYDLQNVISKTPTYVASMSEVEVNILTGNVNPIRVDIIGDVGNSPNPDVDIGQMYGGYIFSLGQIFKEERTWNSSMKSLITDTWDYKVPCTVDIPSVFNVDFFGVTGPYSVINQTYVLDAKAITECSHQLANSTFFAAKEAIRAYRKQQLGNTLAARKFDLRFPATPDVIQAAAGFTPAQISMS
jgi:xanthine dehydrogenase molybdopterin-binding subunit B/xanthine dehydrogenase iron-sulfur cluster and FAD-binding subunit A